MLKFGGHFDWSYFYHASPRVFFFKILILWDICWILVFGVWLADFRLAWSWLALSWISSGKGAREVFATLGYYPGLWLLTGFLPIVGYVVVCRLLDWEELESGDLGISPEKQKFKILTSEVERYKGTRALADLVMQPASKSDLGIFYSPLLHKHKVAVT